MKSINKWTKFIYDNFLKIITKLNYENQQKIKTNVENILKLFEVPQFEEDGALKKDILTEEQRRTKLEAPLKEGVLRTYCGVPIVFVINKSDVVTESEDRYYRW